MVSDLRGLNDISKFEPISFKSVNELITEIYMSSPKLFCSFDMANPFHHLVLEEETAEKTGFVADTGHQVRNGKRTSGKYQFNRLRMGLHSAPTALASAINPLFCWIPGLALYVDDVALYASKEEELLDSMERFLRSCCDNNLLLSPHKSKIMEDNINFGGMNISARGLQPDMEKIDIIQQLQPPKNLRDV